MSNELFQTEETTFLPQRTIGPFRATVTIEEIATDDLEITKHPVQQGASIADHAYSLPAVLTIRTGTKGSRSELPQFYAQLLKLKSDRIPMKVVTGKRTYRNMLIQTLTQINDERTENILSVTFGLEEIFIVGLEAVGLPPRAQQKQPEKTGKTENTGKKTVQGVTESEKAKSIAASIRDLIL